MTLDFEVPSTLPEAAVEYAKHGWPVIPIQPCGSINSRGEPSKEPIGELVPHGSKEASTDVETVRSWWRQKPTANVGIVGMSAKEPFAVLDVDTHGDVNGFDSVAKSGEELPQTLTARTPSGGVHKFCKWTRGERPHQTQSNIRDRNGAKILGVDVRGVNGYVLVYPSRTVRGQYEWIDGESGMAEFPEWAKRRGVTPAKARGETASQPDGDPPTQASVNAPQPPRKTGDVRRRASAYLAKVAPAVEGQGGQGMLLHAAEILVVGFELDDQTALDLLWNEYNPRCRPPWDRGNAAEVREFERKVSEAHRVSTNASGYLLGDAPRAVPSIEATGSQTAPLFERFGHKVDGDSTNGCDTYGRELDDIDGCKSYFVTVNAGREGIREAVSRNAAEIAKRIVEARRATNAKGGVTIPPATMRELTNAVTVMWLRSRGRLFWNAQTKAHADSLFFDIAKGRLYKIESDFFQSKIANATDVSRSGQTYKALRALIQDAAVCPDVAAGVIPSKYYDRRGDSLYISNGDSEMVRVTATEISTVRNGTDDVVFLEGYTLPKWTLLDGDGEDPFDAAPLFANASYLSTSGKMLLRLWWLCLFAKMRKRPPLLVTGQFHAGKSMLFDGINTMLANCDGTKAEVTDTPTGKVDFWTAIHAGGIYCIDNADSRISWLSDTLQRISTFIALPKRKLYKDDELVCLYPNADIVVTSNNPKFADDCGLSDRFIIVRLVKRPEGEPSADAALTDDLLKRRDAALTWTARTLQRALAIPPDADAGGRINGRHPDFATFALRCADALGCRREAEAALMEAELDKSLIVLQNADVARDILAYLRTVNGKWDGKASVLARAIWTDVPDDERAVRDAGRAVAGALKRYGEPFRACFTFDTTNTGGVTVYHFRGMDERLKTAQTAE